MLFLFKIILEWLKSLSFHRNCRSAGHILPKIPSILLGVCPYLWGGFRNISFTRAAAAKYHKLCPLQFWKPEASGCCVHRTGVSGVLSSSSDGLLAEFEVLRRASSLISAFFIENSSYRPPASESIPPSLVIAWVCVCARAWLHLAVCSRSIIWIMTIKCFLERSLISPRSSVVLGA